MRFFLQLAKYIVLFCLLLVILGVAAAGGTLYYLVVINPGHEIDQENIEAILGRESPVLFNDGTTVIGVLFQDYHRQYLNYDQIPHRFIQALVAAEDNRFFQHHGIDLAGITRAMIANFRAGRIVQGGSTLTQQTAKNLFKRKSRSYQAKLKELIYALRLEYRYPKEKILEFYCNQFYVSGNGHGLGVAARYYFNKEPEELTLLECAFIAGSVKRPNYYNPFIKKNRSQAELAKKRAEQRAAYVLGNMLRQGMITRRQYREAMNDDLVFHQGRMTWAVNTIMDLVKEGLSAPLINEALEEHGISNISTSGVRIITTVDPVLQEATEQALRRHLSRLDVRLRGYDRQEVQEQYAQRKLSRPRSLQPGDFLLGTVSSIRDRETDHPLVVVHLGDAVPEGQIDRQGMLRILTALVKHRKNRWSEVDPARDLPLLLGELEVGDRVFVSVRRTEPGGRVFLDLERYPDLQGAALVMRRGSIVAMSGGMDNRFFNRAVDGRRLMGSTFKPFLFTAALQLGWNSTDSLNNRRNVFVFMDRAYFPRPDHHSPHARVSMSWAGVQSENVAAVWLLYHLTDNLTPPRLRELARLLDMAPRIINGRQEGYQSFSARIRDRFGIRIDRQILEQAAYDTAIKTLESDFLFEGRDQEYDRLRELPYGLHFDRFQEEIREELIQDDLKESRRRELRLRLGLLRHSYLSLQPLVELLRRQRDFYEQLLRREQALFFLPAPPLPQRPEGFLAENDQGAVIFSRDEAIPEDWQLLGDSFVLSLLRPLDEEGRDRFWQNILLEGKVSSAALAQVQAQMERERLRLLTARPYSMEVLSKVRDYRIMLGLQYLIALGKSCGIRSRLEPVLSFPLGSNVVTLAEMVRVYETLVSGHRYFLPPGPEEQSSPSRPGEDRDGLAIIDRIESAEGRVLYRRTPEVRRVVDPKISAMVSHILQNTVRFGTGRYAWKNVRLHSADPEREQEYASLDQPVPLLGKTGTANRFRNAAFLGFVPLPAQDGESVLSLEDGYTLGAYVGYDDNRPMISGSTHITGSAGGLPVWTDIASAILDREQAGERLDPVDLTFNGLGLRYPDLGELFVPADPDQGGLIVDGRAGRPGRIAPDPPSILTFGPIGGDNTFEPARFFFPFWKTLARSPEEKAATEEAVTFRPGEDGEDFFQNR